MADDRQQPNHDETIRALARNEAKVEALTDSMRELKKAVEELIDRVDADIDTLRSKAEGFAVTTAAVADIQRRTIVLETKVEAVVVDHAKLETKLETSVVERAKLDMKLAATETKLEAIQIRVWMASGAVGTLVWILTRFFK